mgnify:CR=1 FL=1
MEISMNKTVFEATQRVFTEAYKHIITQGVPSISLNGGCVYRLETESGHFLSCAFAPCIREYDPEMEDIDAMGLLESWTGLLYGWSRKADPAVCIKIQAAHDEPARYSPVEDFIDIFKLKMNTIAKKYNFEIPEVTK